MTRRHTYCSFVFPRSNRINYVSLGCSLIAQERLNRITQFVNEITLSGCIPSTPKLDDQLSSYTNSPDRESHSGCIPSTPKLDDQLSSYTNSPDRESLSGCIPSTPKLDDQLSSYTNSLSPDRESFSDWMACAIPLDGAAAITAAAAGIISDDEILQLSPKIWDSRCQSPVSVTASDASDFCQFRDIEKDGKNNVQDHDTCDFEGPKTHNSMERMHGNCEGGQVSPCVGTPVPARGRALERLGSSASLFRWSIYNHIILGFNFIVLLRYVSGNSLLPCIYGLLMVHNFS